MRQVFILLVLSAVVCTTLASAGLTSWLCNLLKRSREGCRDGYYCRLMLDGGYIEMEINECRYGCHNCGGTEECVNTPGSYQCVARSSDNCPLSIPPAPCDDTAVFRSIDGTCNNLKHVQWGQGNQALRRMILPLYKDNLGSVRGGRLPNPRVVTHRMFAQPHKYHLSSNFTHMQMLWGQFIDHDISHTPMMPKSEVECNCTDSSRDANPGCLSVDIAEDDPMFDTTDGCMELRRSIHSSPGQCGTARREQISVPTSFIDGSLVYGSDSLRAALLRSYSSGELATSEGDLLPQDNNPGASGIACDLPQEQRENNTKCYVAGDNRVNVWVGLTAIHLVFVREHNRIARVLYPVVHEANPTWTDGQVDERVYQTARRIIYAQLQVITYKEYLPRTIGEAMMQKFSLPLTEEYIYRPETPPMIINAFSTAAFRFGHAEIPDASTPKNAEFENITTPLFYEDMFFRPDSYAKHGQDSLLCGIIAEPSLNAGSRSKFSQQIRDKLFFKSFMKGSDLPAINIQRGRDHGLPGYNEYRRILGLSKVNSFEKLSDTHDWIAISKFKELYRNVNDIDLYVGGITERLVEGAHVGPTFSAIIGKQFKNLKFGDRFFFQNKYGPQAFTSDQMKQLERVTLAKVMCDNHHMHIIPRDVFHLDTEMVSCGDLPSLNLTDFLI